MPSDGGNTAMHATAIGKWIGQMDPSLKACGANKIIRMTTLYEGLKTTSEDG